MERYVVTAPPARNHSKSALYGIPLVTEFRGELHEDGEKLFCTSCIVVLNNVRNSTIRLIKKKAEFEEQNVRKKQRSLTASLQCNSTAQTEKVSVIQDFVKMCLEANIPQEKADHPAVRVFLSRTWEQRMGPYLSQTSCGEHFCLMDTRMKINSSAHKIVDKAVMTT